MTFAGILTSALISKKQIVSSRACIIPLEMVVFPGYPSQLSDLAAFPHLPAVFAIELLAL